ncbi:LOW QUALITY PROTEIN: myosin XVB [Mantella aurantiaca]
MLLSVNPCKSLNIYSLDMAQIYQDVSIAERPPHIFAVAEEAFILSRSSENPPNILLSGHSGSGKTEAVKLLSHYLTSPQRRQGDRILQILDFFTILESFGNAKTALNRNSSRFGQILQVFLHSGVVVGCSVSHYLLEKSRVVFQALRERGFHVFYELLQGLPENEKQSLYLQEPETYYYLNQGRACDLPGKSDQADFQTLGKSLRGIGLTDSHVTSIWAILSAILQLGNICFTSFHRDAFGSAAGFRITEIRIVANLLQISPEELQKAITQRVTMTSYDQVLSPLTVEASIDIRDAIAQSLYALLFDWLLEKGNDWLRPRDTDRSFGIIDICGFEDLAVNSLDQICRNFANEEIQRHSMERLLSQEQAEYAKDSLCWIPPPLESHASCLGLLTNRPHGIFHILEEQTQLPQATDHTFLQKCHYHHGDSSCYTKPKLPLPVFTVQHYSGPVTYQVHNFLSKNQDRLPAAARDVLAQSRLRVIRIFCFLGSVLLSDLFKRSADIDQAAQPAKSKGKSPRSTLTGRFQMCLQDLIGRLKRSHVLFVRCIAPNPKKLPGIFDVEFVSSQLRNSGILEAVQILKDGYPIRTPFREFVSRFGPLAGKDLSFPDDRECCAAVLSKTFGDSSPLYQIGIAKVFLKEEGWELLRKKWDDLQKSAALTLQRNLRGFLNRKNFQAYRRKITVIQAHVRGRQARRRYRRLKYNRVQFGAVLLISRIPSIHRRICQDLSVLEVPAGLAALLNSAHAKQQAEGSGITEVPPPQVKAQTAFTLPPDINNYPLSIFIRSYFRDPFLPPLGQPLQDPLTRVSHNDHDVALELYKLALRFMGNTAMQPWQHRIMGNYIVERCLRQPSLKDELLCQAASLTVQNGNEEQNQRAWLLLSGLLSCIIPSPTLEKPLLKYVSDQGFEGYRAICQSKMLRAKQNNLGVFRSHAPTLLEWTANERKGKMIMDVFTFNEEKYSTEVDSWTTGEQLAGWLLQSRGAGDNLRGWSVSILNDDQWFDLSGDDFLLDKIAEIEEGAPSQPFIASDYPFGDDDDIPEPPTDFAPLLPPGHPSFPGPELPPDAPPLNAPRAPPAPPFIPFGGPNPSIPPAPPMLAPPLPAALMGPGVDEMDSGNNSGGPRNMENYLDQLFDPVLSSPTDLERANNLNWRMKGGGGIGPTRQNAYSGYSGIGSMPAYNMPAMNGMMPAMGMMPSMPGMMPQQMMPQQMMPQQMMPQQMMPQPMMPQMMAQPMPMAQPVMPSMDQQAFIQQQAVLLAQQMTLQAATLSQQQQQQALQAPKQRSRDRSPPPPSKPPPPKVIPKPSPAPPPPSKPVPAPPADPPAPPPAPAAPPPSSAPNPPPPQTPETGRPERHREVYWDEVDDAEYSYQRKTFQQKRDFFQKMEAERIRVKSVKTPSKILLPAPAAAPESDSDEEPPEPPEPEPQPGQSLPRPPPLLPPPPKPADETDHEPKPVPIVTLQPRSKPSREIRDIIKMFQTRPQEEPKPYEPVRRTTQTFLKKKDPKQEALERLKNAAPVTDEDAAKPPPPPPPPAAKEKKNDVSNSMREKQKPLLGLFAAGLMAPAPAAQTPKGAGRTIEGDHTTKSALIKHSASVYFSYSDVKLYLRKEIFYPREKFTHPYYLNLLCEQIIRDTFSDTSFKLSREERQRMKDFLKDHQVGNDAGSIADESVKKRIVVAARDNWENYFSRLFPVTLEGDVESLLLGVSHRGIRLLKDVNPVGTHQRYLKSLRSYSYVDILSLRLSDPHTLHFSLRTEDLSFRSSRAPALKGLVEMFLQELVKDSNHVVALRSHITDDKSLLQFKKGDIIKVQPMDGLQPGWQFGSLGGHSGIFPSQCVQPAAAPDYHSPMEFRESQNRPRPKGLRRTTSTESGKVSEISVRIPSPSPQPFDAAHYTMVEFALKYFREAQSMLGWKGMAAEGKKAIDLVQHTKVPIQESLIFYTDKELNELATNNFMALMRFMGDQQYREQDDVKCIYEILVLCREKPVLKDEVYCQVLKQITENPKTESCSRGWIVLSLLTGYFLPTPTLLPCVTKYLQDTTGDFQEISRECQEHLRHTLLYHGRRHIPPRKEVEALLNGRVSRRVVIILPGGVEYSTKIKTFTVAADLVPEVCEQLMVTDPNEVEEFAIFANKNKGEMVRPLRVGDYIHDFFLQDNSVTLEFKRVTWKATLKGRSELYIQVHFSQVRLEYMQGKALLLSPQDKLEMFTGTVAAILHKVKGMSNPPDKQELLSYIPDSVQNRINLQAAQQFLLQEMRNLNNLNVQQAKLRFLEKVSALPLFEYTIFAVKRISEPDVISPCYVAVNDQQLNILQSNSQKPHIIVHLQEVQSMRTMRPLDSNTPPGVELHYGSADNPRTLWMELQEAKELYHTLALIIENKDASAT